MLFFFVFIYFLIEIILILIFPIYLSSPPTPNEVNTLYLILKVECGKFQQRKQHVQRPKGMGKLEIVLRFILWERTRTISEDQDWDGLRTSFVTRTGPKVWSGILVKSIMWGFQGIIPDFLIPIHTPYSYRLP